MPRRRPRPTRASTTPGLAQGYWLQWLAALERLSVAKGLVGADALVARRDAWAAAARATPHGHPIELPPRAR